MTNLASDSHDAATADTAVDAAVDAGAAVLCGAAACACDNGVDDDNDGLIDGFDPECTGAHDNDERVFSIPMSSTGDCDPCFFGEPDVECSGCAVSKACEDSCRPYTPNGCDCFGCCTVERAGMPVVNIRIDNDCSLATIGDEFACPPCVPNDSCRNPCGRCELCLGRTAAQLPKDCKPGASSMQMTYKCDDRERVCSADKPCAAGLYCQLGCCLPTQ